MKKLTVTLLALLLLFSLAACGDGGSSGAPAGDRLRFVTGGESATYYAFGSVIAQHATNHAGVEIVGLVGNGSQANVFEMEDGNAELGLCQSDVMDYAYHGTNLFEDTGAVTCFSTVGALYTEQVQIVTLRDDIRTIEDLKGKNVSVGAPGSGSYFNAIDILGVYGMALDDIKPTYQSYGDSADALKNGQIDAALLVSGAPTAAIADLAATRNVTLVSLDDAHIEKLLAASPYYVRCSVSKELYGMESDALTVGVAAVLLARNEVSEDAIYALCADLYENAPEMVSSHAKFTEVSPEYGASITSVPYHPGAARYFAEKGFRVN